MSRQTLEQRVATLLVHQPHAPDMSSEVAFVDEVGERELRERRRTDVERIASLDERVPQRWRYDDVPDAESRK